MYRQAASQGIDTCDLANGAKLFGLFEREAFCFNSQSSLPDKVVIDGHSGILAFWMVVTWWYIYLPTYYVVTTLW